MTRKEKLYEAFGELVYTVAIADGYIQAEETEALQRLLNDHPWSKEIEWSFRYEVDNKRELKEVYEKALDTFAELGPDKEYEFMLEVLDKVAHASSGGEEDEARVIHSFKKDLIARFEKDLERLKLMLNIT